MLAKDTLEEFKLECELRRLTPRTIKGYYNSTLLFLTWLERQQEIKELEAIRPQHIKQYIQYLIRKQLTPSYINAILRCLRAYFRYIVNHHDKYGWTITSPSDRLLQFCLDNDLSDILINRNEYGGYRVTGTGTHSPTPPPVVTKTSSTRKYICPCCGNSVRATKNVNIGCLDCAEQMVLAG
jgi:hypothetical protein